MIYIIDRIILYAFGCILVAIGNSMPEIMVTALAALILAGINLLLIDRECFFPDMIVCAVVCVLALVEDKFLSFMPLFMYSYVCKYFNTISYRWISFISIGAAFAGGLLISKPQNTVLNIFTMIIGFFSAYKSSAMENQSRKIRSLRDDSKENTILLENKNRLLMENQNNNIHIAVLGERNRIAREIHDNVGHLLSRSILQIGAIISVTTDETSKKLIEPLHDTLVEAMNSIRESVHDLHKESFDVNAAAKKILEELKGFDYEFKCDISRDADANVKYAFLTILKETINNIMKYCDGDFVNIMMVELEEYYQMVVEDNGIAVRTKRIEADLFNEGIGLSNIKQRIESMGGFVTFSRERGFRVFISIPKNK